MCRELSFGWIGQVREKPQVYRGLEGTSSGAPRQYSATPHVLVPQTRRYPSGELLLKPGLAFSSLDLSEERTGEPLPFPVEATQSENGGA